MNIDFHDDLGEAYFRSLGDGEPHEILKTASWTEKTELLDRDFALILVDGEGREHRKFACQDTGNAAISQWYLENTDHGLPSNAIAVATHNIKIAMGEQHTLTIQDSGGGRGYVIDERRVKVAMAPQGPPGTLMAGAKPSPAGFKTQLPASPSAAMGQGMSAASVPMGSQGLTSKMSPQMGRGGFRAPMGPGGGKTPQASASPYDILEYAQDNWDDLDAYDRHDIAVYLCKEGSAVGVVTPDHIYKYGGETLNPHFEMIMERRKKCTIHEQIQDNYDNLGKMAGVMEPLEVVNALFLIDEQASFTPRYGSTIPDPLLSVFGQEKEAEYSWIHGGDMVNEKQLQHFASVRSCMLSLGELFTEELCNKFKKDPIGTFKDMPDEQKTILSRLATQNGYSSDGGHFS